MRGRRQSQSGVALLLFLFIVFIAGATLMISATNSTSQRLALDAKTQLALEQAKEAVIAWSVSHPTSPGQLPCPEDTSLIGTANEGQALGACTQIGRIAWRTLGLTNATDASGETLWYMVSPGFQNYPPPGTSGIPAGQLQLDGNNGIAALIIAPGVALAGQNRSVPSSANPPLASNYLDLGNAGGPAFVTTGPAGAFNDRVIAITSQDLFQAMRFRVLAEIRGAFGLQNGLRQYFSFNSQFPPNNTDLSTLKFDSNTKKWLAPWFSLVNYSNPSVTPPLIAPPLISLGGLSLTVMPCTTTPCP